MALLAGDVIDAARDRSAAFDRKKHPNKMLLRVLSAYVRQLNGKIMAIDPDAVRVEVTQAMPLTDFDAGIALPANVQYVAEAAARYAAPSTFSPHPIEIIQSDERHAKNRPSGTAWVVNGRLYLSHNAAAWRLFDQVAISVVVLPAALVALDDVLSVPDAAELACVEALALFLAQREKGEIGDLTPPAEREYLNTVMNNVAGRTFYTVDVR